MNVLVVWYQITIQRISISTSFAGLVYYFIIVFFSRVYTPVLTRELRGGCGAGGVLRGEGHDVTRGGGMTSRGMTSRGGGYDIAGYDIARGRGESFNYLIN